MLPITREFLRGFPDVHARLVLVDRPVDLVDEGLDVALRIGVLSDSSAIAIRVGAVRRVVVAAPAYLARHGAPSQLSELSDRDVIVSAGLGATDRWLFADAAVPLAPRLIVTTAEAAIEAAKDGLGITRVLSYQAADALGAGTLAALFTKPEDRAVPVHILYPGGRHPAPKLRAFVDFAVPRLRTRLDRLAQSLS
jgi:DNA-binding transcriptional LysR family regulator